MFNSNCLVRGKHGDIAAGVDLARTVSKGINHREQNRILLTMPSSWVGEVVASKPKILTQTTTVRCFQAVGRRSG